jgi:SH3-like domain-containing protein
MRRPWYRSGSAVLLVICAHIAGTPCAVAATDSGGGPDGSGLPVPRFVSLRAEEANMRTGPGEQYPIKWTYQRAGLPLEIIAEYHHWRRVRDWQGTEGWMHSSMLTGRRGFMVKDAVQPLRAEPSPQATVLAEVEPKVIGRIEECPKAVDWCRVRIDSIKGWLDRRALWGVYPGEEVD